MQSCEAIGIHYTIAHKRTEPEKERGIASRTGSQQRKCKSSHESDGAESPVSEQSDDVKTEYNYTLFNDGGHVLSNRIPLLNWEPKQVDVGAHRSLNEHQLSIYRSNHSDDPLQVFLDHDQYYRLQQSVNAGIDNSQWFKSFNMVSQHPTITSISNSHKCTAGLNSVYLIMHAAELIYRSYELTDIASLISVINSDNIISFRETIHARISYVLNMRESMERCAKRPRRDEKVLDLQRIIIPDIEDDLL